MNGSNIDAAGRAEVALPNSVGDYVFTQNLQPELFDVETGSGGTVTHSPATNSAELGVTNSGDFAIISSRQAHKYLPGRAIQPEFTHFNLQPVADAVKRIGYFSSSTSTPFDSTRDGLFLESINDDVSFVISNKGSEDRIPSTDWDQSKITGDLNFENFQISLFDFLFLGGSSAKLFNIVEAKRRFMAVHHHSNETTGTIIGHPSQPIRAEIRSTGGAGLLNFVCANITSSGSAAEKASYGLPFVCDSGETIISFATAGTKYATLAMRKKTMFSDFEAVKISAFSSGGATEGFRWRLLINPTLSSAWLTWNSSAASVVEHAVRPVSDGTLTVSADGNVIAVGYGSSRSSSSSDINNAIRIGTSIAGVHDVLVLEITPFSNTVDVAFGFEGAEYQ